MTINEFIEKYTNDSGQGFCQMWFYGEIDKNVGFSIPEGFQVLVDISRFPLFLVATNRKENAVIYYYGEKVTLSIYDHIVQMEVSVEKYRDYFNSLYNK